MPESPCSECGQMCLHTDDDTEPLCDDCHQYRVRRDLILDIALGRVPVDHVSIGKGERIV